MIGGVRSSISARPVPGSRPGRKISDPASRLRRATAARRILCRALPHYSRLDPWSNVYPYVPGGEGTSIAEFLSGDAKLGRITEPPPTVFREGSGVVMNTIPPNDFSFYESLNEVVQQEPATALDPELMGPLAAIGIIKGKPFAPDARMKKILTEALTLANATSRSLLVEAA